METKPAQKLPESWLSNHWKVGATAVSAAAIGDFLTPAHGYVITSTVGALALILGLWVWRDAAKPLAIEAADGNGSKKAMPFWRRYPPSHCFVFAMVLFAIGAKSWSHAAEGGLLASVVPAIGDAQSALGLLHENVRLQRETRDAVERLSSTLKRETSENPRKELANRGIAWTEDALAEAMDHRDTETVDLFLRGKFNIADSKFLMGRIGMRHFSSSEFAHDRTMLEQLHAGGLDFIGNYADRLDRLSWDEAPYDRRDALYANPVMTVLGDGNVDAAHWLTSHGDTSRLSSFAEVLAAGMQSCPSSEQTLAVARFLVQSGIPSAKAREAVATSPSGPSSAACQQVAEALQQ